MFLIAALILLAIIFFATFASKWRVPLVLISLLAGILFGSDVLRMVEFGAGGADDYANARQIADFALVFVLFIGGFGTKWERFKAVFAPAMILATVGVMMTAAVTTVLLHYVLRLPFQQALLIGCIIASTDAAAVFSILRSRSLDPKLSSLVEIESATNDPMAIILTTVAVSFVAHTAASAIDRQPLYLAIYLVWQIVGGVGIGLLIGRAAVVASRYIADLDKGYYYIYIISIIMLSFGVADVAKASGILSAFFAGFVLGNSKIPYKATSSTLLDALSTIGNVIIFVLLGLLVSPKGFMEVYVNGIPVYVNGILLFLLLTFVARPVAVLICMYFAKYNVKEKMFLCWSGLRGAVPIVLATYPAAERIPGSTQIFNIVFFAVLLSMLVQGGTISKLSDMFKLSSKAKPKPKQVMELVSLHDSGMELIEIDVDDDIYIGKARVSDFKLPAGTTITMINRNDRIMAPTGGTEIIAGDMLYVLAKIEDIDKVNEEVLRHFKIEAEPISPNDQEVDYREVTVRG